MEKKLKIQRVSSEVLGWVAVDNRDGDAWTEDFRWKHHAVRWLRDEGSSVYAHFGS